MKDITYKIVGDCAIQIEFGNEISLDNNRKVKMLQQIIEQNWIHGVVELVPTYRSLIIHYYPDIIRYQELYDKVNNMLGDMVMTKNKKTEIIEVPILYGGELGPELSVVAKAQGISEEELIKIHTSHLHYIYLLGFSPGHPYTVRFDEPFKIERCATPKLNIPGRSIVVIEDKTNIIPFSQPTGWYVIGSTPVLQTDYRKENPFLFEPGLWVKYVAINQKEYDAIKKEADAGTYQCVRYTKELE